MEEALQPLEADQRIRSNKYFALGIAASVILHLICTIALFLPQGSPAPPSVTYIDLSMAQRPAPMTAPPKEAAPEKVAQKPELPLVPDTPLAPEPHPEAQQLKAVPDQPAVTQDTKVEEQRSRTTFGLGLTKGYFKSLGDGETLREGVKGYYLEMLQGINEKWWLDQQLDKRRIDSIVVNVTVARNGEIVGSKIMMSSGNPRYDRAVLSALTAASPLPPLPASYEGEFFQAPIRLVPPLHLMAW
jgi:periplasmic protein TonB